MTAYAELQAASNFSFLRSGSSPEELVVRAALGHPAIALTDRNTLAGVVHGHVAAKEAGMGSAVGTRLDLEPEEGARSKLCFPIDRAAFREWQGRTSKP